MVKRIIFLESIQIGLYSKIYCLLTCSNFELIYVQILNRMQNNKNNNIDEEFNLLRLLDKKPDKSQRKIAEELGFSLGKLNYCIKALKKKGLIKISNFRKNDNKLYYLYLLTPKGIKKKAEMTINYLKKKSKEYEELKKELGEIKKNNEKK